MKRHPLVWFFVIAFAITWGLGLGMVVFGDVLAEHFGEFSYDSPFWKVIFHIAVYAPAIAAQHLTSPELVDLCFEHCRNLAPLHHWLVRLTKDE